MGSEIKIIVCYLGGTCGDLLSALIDTRDVKLQINGSVNHVPERTKLKKPHLFLSSSEKDNYLKSVNYTSISSHDTEYHIQQHHSFISIGVQYFDTAMWAALRFKNLHQDHVWAEMQDKCGASKVEDYARTIMNYSNLVEKSGCHVLKLESILQGTAVADLEKIINKSLGAPAIKFYEQWLNAQEL